MSNPMNLLAVVAVLCVMGGFIYGVRLLVEKQSEKLGTVLDEYDYVVLEAAPEQLTRLRSDFERNGWRLSDSKLTTSRRVLCTFVKSAAHASSLSQLLGVGHKTALLSADKSNSDFPIKIKAHGRARDLHPNAMVSERADA